MDHDDTAPLEVFTVNCTPHDIHVMDEEGQLRTFRASGTVLRVDLGLTRAFSFDGVTITAPRIGGGEANKGAIKTALELSGVIGEERELKLLIVSRMFAEAIYALAEYEDNVEGPLAELTTRLLVPASGEAARDREGNILYVPSLTMSQAAASRVSKTLQELQEMQELDPDTLELEQEIALSSVFDKPLTTEEDFKRVEEKLKERLTPHEFARLQRVRDELMEINNNVASREEEAARMEGDNVVAFPNNKTVH